MGETLIRMPKLADTLVEGTLGQWLKQVGQQISAGEPLASIETDKVTTELSSPSGGTLLEVLVAEGQTVPVETPIARIGTEVPVAPPGGEASKPTPVAARLLADHGLTADQVPSRTGRLTKDEVLAHLGAAAPPGRPPTASKPGTLLPLTSMRRAIADHMLQAYQSIPVGQTVVAADLSELVAWRKARKAAFQHTQGANLTFTVFFVYALARHLARAGTQPVDLGVAVALDGGLIVPVLRAADSLSLGATARGIADLAGRARANKLSPTEVQGAQMTVTNVGSFGNLSAAPIVPLGQVGILAPGLVERRPLPGMDGGIRPGWRCLISLMFDRRVLSDFNADKFLQGVVAELASIPHQIGLNANALAPT